MQVGGRGPLTRGSPFQRDFRMKSMFRDGALYAQWMERCEEFGIEVRTIEVILTHLSVKACCYPSQISLHTLHMPSHAPYLHRSRKKTTVFLNLRVMPARASGHAVRHLYPRRGRRGTGRKRMVSTTVTAVVTPVVMVTVV